MYFTRRMPCHGHLTCLPSLPPPSAPRTLCMQATLHPTLRPALLPVWCLLPTGRPLLGPTHPLQPALLLLATPRWQLGHPHPGPTHRPGRTHPLQRRASCQQPQPLHLRRTRHPQRQHPLATHQLVLPQVPTLPQLVPPLQATPPRATPLQATRLLRVHHHLGTPLQVCLCSYRLRKVYGLYAWCV